MKLRHALWGVEVGASLPARLWRRILEASDGDEQLARVTLATAFLVAAEQVANPPRPARPRQPRPYLGPEYLPRDSEPMTEAEMDAALDDSYVVGEQLPHEMPADDPWRRSWD